MRIEIADSLSIEYDDVGTGAVVVLLHAFPLSRAMWRPQVEALRDTHRLIVPDLRGFGGSGPFGEAPSLQQMADDVAGLLDALAIREQIVLGGLSMGGYIALAFARTYAERLRGLILADTRAEADGAEAKANRDKLIAFTETHTSCEVIDQLLPKLVSEETRLRNSTVVDELRRIASTQTQAGIIGALRVLRDRPDATPSLGSIRVPTLVIVGSDDALTPPAAAETLAGKIAGATLVRIPGAGHMSNLEQPAAFNAAVQNLLKA